MQILVIIIQYIDSYLKSRSKTLSYFIKLKFEHMNNKSLRACQDVLRRVWPLMNRYQKKIVQTFTPTLSMHQKLTEHEECDMKDNNLRTKSHARFIV